MKLQEELANAFRLHRAGELTQAAWLCETILSRDPEEVDAVQLLGVLRQQQGRFAEAVELCGKAVALRPGEASNHSNLAEAHRALGQFEKAVVHCRTALTLRREETEDDLEGVARHLVTACGLDWEPACLDFHRTERPFRTSSLNQVRQPIYRKSVARWKNYERELDDLFSALSETLSRGGSG
jgi:tetratricopeptide (TPR) repeat protein